MKPNRSATRLLVAASALALATLSACRTVLAEEADAGEADDAATATDATPGAADAAAEIGCDPLSPRAVAPELFVGPTGLEPRLRALIDGAQHDLRLMIYLFTDDDLADALIAAHGRGVDVRVILDPDHEGNPDVRARLSGAGIAVEDAASTYPFFHVKSMIIDGDTAVIMSANLNYGAMSGERNYGVVDRDPDDVADLAAIFDSDWAKDGSYPNLSCTRLFVSPVNARNRMLGHINSAIESLDVEAIYVADAAIQNAILDARQRGVAVRVLFADPDDMPENADIAAQLRVAGIETRALASPFVHAKLVVADGVPFVGSQNLSNTSLTQNREIGLLIPEPAPAAIATGQFETDWNAGFSL